MNPLPEPTPPVAPGPVLIPSAPKRPPVRLFVLAGIAGLCLLAGAAYWYWQSNVKPAHAQPVKIGVLMAFSGGSAVTGQGAIKGVTLAKQELKADNIQIIQADSKCDPKEAAEAFKKLMDQKVVAIIGDGCSSASLAVLPTANNAKIPLISPSASSPTLSIPNDYFYRVVPPDDVQGAFIAHTVYKKGYHTAAIFYTNEPYGSDMNSVFRDNFVSAGGEVVASEAAEADDTTFTDAVKRIKNAKPQAIFIAPNLTSTATAFMKAVRAAGVMAPFYSVDALYDPAVITDAPQASEGLTLSSFPLGSSKFRGSLAAAYPNDNQTYAAAQAYDSLHALYIALQGGANSGEAIKNALSHVSFDGVSGHISFDPNGDITSANYVYDLFQIKNGVFTQIE